ncbi:hypothetical protein GCM10029964_104710 [Kibdelosporangium lantanae]
MKRKLLAAVATAVLAVAAIPVGAATAASYRIDTWGAPANVRSGPGTDYPVVGSLAEGTTVSVSCTSAGGGVDGPSGWSGIWDRIGPDRWVADAFVYTGSFDPVAPACGGYSSINPGKYPWPSLGADQWVADGRGYYAGECVSFAAWAVANDGLPDRFSVNWRGNADMWDDDPTTVTVVSTPRVGDVAQWVDDRGGSGPVGHVAYVAAVHDDGTILVLEYNWSAKHRYDARRIGVGAPSRYLRF